MSENNSNSNQHTDLALIDVEGVALSAQTVSDNSNKVTSTVPSSVSATSIKTSSSNDVKSKDSTTHDKVESKKTSDDKEPLVTKEEPSRYHTKSIRTSKKFSGQLNGFCKQALHQVNWFYNQSVRFIIMCFGCLLNSAEYREALKEAHRTGNRDKCFALETKVGLWQTPTPEVLVAISKGWSLQKTKLKIASGEVSSTVDLKLLDTSCMRATFNQAMLAIKDKCLRYVSKGKTPPLSKFHLRDLNANRGLCYIGRSNTQDLHVKFGPINDPKFGSQDKVLYLSVPRKYAKYLPQNEKGEYTCDGIYKGHGTAYIPLKDLAPKVDDNGRNISWSEFHSNPETFVNKIAMVNLYTFVELDGTRRLNINLVCEGIPSPTEGRLKCLQKNSFDYASPSSMESYCNAKTGVDLSTKSLCAYSPVSGLKHLGYTSGPESLTDEIVSLQRKLAVLNLENNPDKIGENGCFLRKSEWTSPWADTPDSITLKEQIADLQRKRTYLRKVDQRRVASEIAGMGGDCRVEHMEFTDYIRHGKKKKAEQALIISPAATQSSVPSASNSRDSSITAQETVIRQEESVKEAKPNNGTESEKLASKNQALLVKTEAVVIPTIPEKVNELTALATLVKRFLGPYFNRSIQFCAPGEGQSLLIADVQSLGGTVWRVECEAGASKHRPDGDVQRQINLLHKHSLSNNFSFIAFGNDVYVVQRDALSALNLCFIDPITGKFDDVALANEFGNFWVAHETLRAQFESYERSLAESRKNKNIKHCDYMREDVNVPTKDVLRKWHLTKSDREALDRIRASFGVRSLIRFHGIGC